MLVPNRSRASERGEDGLTTTQGDFLAALHRRITDRIAWPWARDWLARHARLGLAMEAGWPVLRLILEADPPPTSLLLLQRHYREAAIAGKGSGPLADLAASLEVVEVAP